MREETLELVERVREADLARHQRALSQERAHLEALEDALERVLERLEACDRWRQDQLTRGLSPGQLILAERQRQQLEAERDRLRAEIGRAHTQRRRARTARDEAHGRLETHRRVAERQRDGARRARRARAQASLDEQASYQRWRARQDREGVSP